MKVCVIGTGYVGLVTGACLSGSGNNVICVDIDEDKIRSLEEGHVPFYEPGLEAVGTPPNEDGAADMQYVVAAARSIGEHMNDYKIVVTKSTVPVGTTEMVREEIKKITDIDFDVASNPEFLKEGAAVDDFMKPDRVIIGVDKPSVGEIMRELYSSFMRSGDRAIVVSIRSSELAKYTANAMLATRISFMNEIANLCELVGADISDVRKAVGSDSRIGRNFLYPGIGYGGSCFPKDVKALINTASGHGYDLRLCGATDEVNQNQREIFWKKIERHFGGDLAGKRVGVWGISFKPETDDIREAPSLYVIDKLVSSGAAVVVHDPVALGNAKKQLGEKVGYGESNYDACRDADALVICTEWNEYRQPDFQTMKELMKGQVIFDGRNLYDPKRLSREGFKYYGIGIGN